MYIIQLATAAMGMADVKKMWLTIYAEWHCTRDSIMGRI
jgi:hypothetical protein